ncbi:hypothetical protein CHS0354_027938 [Potamilus streckersoni]|uniref:RING-type domain-containing protein n=1 Tax=Potamilus streckersoni TaxID=2493646 RepID=A0AAE0W654_9BIVA|nr:hypothetical protein CHS0354_027938 [Potamilus streckersoni]
MSCGIFRSRICLKHVLSILHQRVRNTLKGAFKQKIRYMARPENTDDMIPNLPLSSLHLYVGEIMKTTNMDNTRERMKNEWARYISFGTFPRSCPIQPTRLTQAGFYYSGNGDQTICFACDLSCKNWKEGDSPLDVHKRLSPNCNFVKRILDDTIPIRNKVTEFVPHANSATAVEVQDKKVTYGISSSENKNSDNKNESRELSEIQTNLSSAVDRTGEKERPGNTLGTGNSESTNNYIYTCSSSAQVEKKETYDTRNILSERCNRQQEQNDEKVAEHLVNSNETNGSVGSNTMTTELVISEFAQVKQHSFSNRNNTLGVCLEKPKYPHYSNLASRLESFRGWPSHMKQKPADLAAAGFYYVGVGDCVRCFFCGGGLRSWEDGDDIWEEHARWYPECAFLKQCKGEDFVLRQLAGINLRSNYTESRKSAASEKSSQKELCHLSLGSKAREVLPEDPMDYPSTQSVLSIGYKTEMVKKAVQMLISRKGHSKFSSNELMEVIFELENNDLNLHVSEDTDPINDMVPLVPAELTAQNTISGTKDANEDENKQSSSHSEHNNHVEKEKNNYSSQDRLSSKEMESMLEQNQELKDQMTCKICMENEACIVFLPCCHMMACPQCALALIKCPICRKLVRGTVRAYIS